MVELSEATAEQIDDEMRARELADALDRLKVSWYVQYPDGGFSREFDTEDEAIEAGAVYVSRSFHGSFTVQKKWSLS